MSGGSANGNARSGSTASLPSQEGGAPGPPSQTAEAARIAVVIPALNEARSLPKVLAEIPAWVDRVIVADNGSRDDTPRVARRCGTLVVHEPRRGYGAACLAGIAAARDADVIVFLDADYSDHPQQMERLVAPILDGEADLVIGSRVAGRAERGALTIQQRLGNRLACALMRRFWGGSFTDLGPFRAVRASALDCLRMDDRTFGWTVQMQIRALRAHLRVCEAPVDYRRRIGVSKISGTLSGTLRAGSKILETVAHERRCAPPVSDYAVRADHLIVFARDPQPGTTKTRLIPALGAAGAARLQHAMTRHTLLTVDRLSFTDHVSAEVRFAGDDPAAMAALYGPHRCYLRQRDGDLGARLHRAFADAFARGARRVVAIGADCPALDRATLAAAFDRLRDHECVIGPARDGGYYLLGLRRANAALFDGIDWGAGSVRAATLAQAAAAGLSVARLPMLSDVDEPADLSEWRRHRHPQISVIIPTVNEADHVVDAIASAKAARNAEVLVVDGGSTDATPRVAADAGARVLRAPPGRAAQMNAGAAAASGRYLLFLHADSRLPENYAAQVRRLFRRRRTKLGAFLLAIDHPRRAFRMIEWAANMRSRWLRSPYGDQGLAMRASDFYALGGFRDLPIMEDYDLARRVAREADVAIAEASVQTSPRRWLRHGVWRLTLIHQACLLAYRWGAAPERIAQWRGTETASPPAGGDTTKPEAAHRESGAR